MFIADNGIEPLS